MEVVHAAPSSSEKRYVIFIKRGVYMENVEVEFDKKNLMMIGEGVMGGGFIARDMSFRNTAGPMGEQAVALKSLSDFSVFYRCGIFGYQDSLYAHSNRQFYRDCKISGTMDFIFGYAIAVFQNCKLLVKNGLPKQSNTITAQGGKVNGDLTGFSFQFCNISADFDLLPFVKSTSTFFGRPWQSYSTTIFMQSYLSDVLSPKGWLGWNKSQYLDTLYYAEYKNYGPGAKIQGRVKWKQYHILNDYRQTNNFTAAHFILGNLWLSSTGVPFTLGFGSHT
ncbi:pectinesterase/pectinesterase inhibitor PPE8B-like [Cicer arietinum]|uniref:Pectinesterase n=1 Tax=Cicer arietinum TaxID=3827 RepID=A0A1S3EG24_CICAR|nr:pectinesterase/pectinesterase inhibitor PPE8B-like isoform X1 [Cicer arietinum]XP_027188954.1 pectinesterase/pectinesterase inhibitor PPE8B-like isoform X1 [Cicer arietinum]